MDKIFYNGVIKTMDKAYPMASAVAVDNGVIMRIGEDEEILSYKTENTELIDLKGAFMLPGLTDSHMHLMLLSNLLTRADLTEMTSFAQTMEVMGQCAEKVKGTDKWAMAMQFNQDYWTDKKEIPTRRDLDAVVGDTPAYMERACGHIAVLSTKAMELMKMMDEKQGETKFDMGFYEDGTPNGQLYEATVRLVEQYFPVPTVEDVKERLIKVCNHAAKNGLVCCHSDDLNLIVPVKDMPVIMQAYKELAEADELPIRVYEQCRMLNLPMIEQFCKDYKYGTKYGRDFTIGDIKIMSDGSLGAHTAVLRGEYKNAPEDKGIFLHDDEEMFAMFKVAHDAGYSIVVHCIGDGAIEQTLKGYEMVMDENPRPDPRHGIIHCQIMDEAQQDVFNKRNILAYIQPVFVRADAAIVDDCVGEELARQSYNWRRYYDMGVHMSNGTDCPVEPIDPRANIYYAVTRDDGKGGSWYPENALTMEETLELYTIEGAYAAREEAERGSITVGKYADFTVFDTNFMECDPKEVLTSKVLYTVVNGKFAYKAE